MLSLFYPNEYVGDIYKINYRELYDKGIRGIIFDLDNTIIPYEVAGADKKIADFFEELEKMGFALCIASNNNKKRVKTFSQPLKLKAVHYSLKPLPIGVNKALKIMATGKRTALVGDQIFTDVLCGNIKGLYSILVDPIADKKNFSVKLRRYFEKIILKAYLSRRSG